MQFGLFCSPKADAPGHGPETGQGFRDYLDYNVEAEALGYRVRYSSRAIAELEAILSDLATKHPSAAKRFLARMRQVGERIGRFPEGFQEVAQRPGVRRVPLVRYPYLVSIPSGRWGSGHPQLSARRA